MAELGCGISALVALALAPSVQHYVATDQEYVRRLFRTNIDANASVKSATTPKQKPAKSRSSKPANQRQTASTSAASPSSNFSNVIFTTLDWELDQPSSLRECIEPESGGRDSASKSEDQEADHGFDLLLSCDCIYNDALVTPFVRTCAEICRLRPAYEPSDMEAEPRSQRPTICIVAQQQRAPEVFEAWLRETLQEFRVWRVKDEVLVNGLKSGSGSLVHLLLVRDRR